MAAVVVWRNLPMADLGPDYAVGDYTDLDSAMWRPGQTGPRRQGGCSVAGHALHKWVPDSKPAGSRSGSFDVAVDLSPGHRGPNCMDVIRLRLLSVPPRHQPRRNSLQHGHMVVTRWVRLDR